MKTYSWDLYRIHAEALVWESPVVIGDNAELREAVGEARYRWASTPHDPNNPLIELRHAGERSAYRGLLAYLCGYTDPTPPGAGA